MVWGLFVVAGIYAALKGELGVGAFMIVIGALIACIEFVCSWK